MSAPTPTPEQMLAFLSRHYRHDRLLGRGEDYAAAVVQGRLSDLAKFGRSGISHHESATGQAIFFDASQVLA